MLRQTKNSKARSTADISKMSAINEEQNLQETDGACGPMPEQQLQEGLIPGIDPATAQIFKMMMDKQAAEMKQQAAEMKRQAADTERRLDRERFEMQKLMEEQKHELLRRLDQETNEKNELAKELARRDNGGLKNIGKAPRFDLDKDRDNFETWKLKWEDFLISSNINSITKTAVKDEQTKAALTAALSDDTLKWLNGQGFDPNDLRHAGFIIKKMEEHIQGTTNPYVQVVELIGRKKSSNESFDHFVTDVCERVKRCALDKVTNVTDWFTTMIVVANHDDVEVRKKLLLEKDLKLDTAKAICKEEEKAAKTSRMLGASRTSSSESYGASQVQNESAAAVSGYQVQQRTWPRPRPRSRTVEHRPLFQRTRFC